MFPPDSVPALDSNGLPGSYTRATVHYLDARGREVDTMAPGGRIAVTEYDDKDQVTGSLTPANRERAVAAGDKRSLWTERYYAGTDGIDLQWEKGPVRDIRLPDGTTQAARPETTYAYAGPPHLATSTTTRVLGASGAQADARTTATEYNASLRLPTAVTVDSGGLGLVTRTSYNADGQVTERRQPKAGASGASPLARQTIYWTAGTNGQDSDCAGKPQWAGLPCKTGPTAQPAAGPSLPVAMLMYDRDLNVTSRTERDGAGAVLRTTTTTYDGAGRKATEAVTGQGDPLPALSFTYDGAGRLWKTSDGTREITRTYDAATGQPTGYADADGIQSSASYDVDGRPVAVSDGKGSQSLTYDAVTGDLTQVADSGAGTFSAAYDADGRVVSQGYPGGIFAATTYDNAGRATGLAYTKTTNCSSACTWLGETAAYSIHGQVRASAVTRPGQADALRQYSYDGAGRIAEARDTPAGQACTIRSYAYDPDSNRTSLSTRVPASGSACDPNAAPAVISSSIDDADRLGGPGYDALGRATSVPGAQAGGGALTASYYVSDLAHTVTQDGQTRSFGLDPLRRVRSEASTGPQSGTRIQHYASDGDSPAWTADQADPLKWTRSITGPDGGLAAVQDSQDGISLQLPSLHGDIAATASPDPAATGLASVLRSDEFGSPQGPAPARYQWLGAKQRQTALASGVITMGARLYDPAIGRFLQTDAIPGGSANDYDYANQDPLNQVDLNGRAPGTYDVRDTYMDSDGRSIALRWGNKRFGYRHIRDKRGFTAVTDLRIQRALLLGERTCVGPSCDRTVYSFVRPTGRNTYVEDIVVVGNNPIQRRTRTFRLGVITYYRRRGGYNVSPETPCSCHP